MELLERPTPLPLVGAHPGLMLVALHGGLTRVTRRDGEVLGYVETVDEELGRRYRAKRMPARQPRFLIIGEFWTADEAIDALRYI